MGSQISGRLSPCGYYSQLGSSAGLAEDFAVPFKLPLLLSKVIMIRLKLP